MEDRLTNEEMVALACLVGLLAAGGMMTDNAAKMVNQAFRYADLFTEVCKRRRQQAGARDETP